MDDIVLKAMAKWPDVPAAFGWLSLDRRGHWLIKGETIGNAALNAFISRNYTHDDQGRWFFQNGPQRVFVELAYTPWVYIAPDAAQPCALLTHTQQPVREVRSAWIDDSGALLLSTEHGIGLMHDGDLESLLPLFVNAGGNAVDEDMLETLFEQCAHAQAVQLWFQFDRARVKINPVRAAEVAQQFNFQSQPQDIRE